MSAILVMPRWRRFTLASAAVMIVCALLATISVAQAQAGVCHNEAVGAKSLCVSEAWVSGGSVFLIASSSPEVSLCVGLTTWNGTNWADSSPVACGDEPYEELSGYSGHPYVYNNSNGTVSVCLTEE
jgi:hypothetical protein